MNWPGKPGNGEQLAEAAEGGAAGPDPGLPSEEDQQLLAALPLQHVLLLDRRATDLRREFIATTPPPMVRALCDVSAQPTPWRDSVLALLDAMPPEAATDTTVVVADEPGDRGMHETGRVARLHPGVPVVVVTSEREGTTGAIFDRLRPIPAGPPGGWRGAGGYLDPGSTPLA